MFSYLYPCHYSVSKFKSFMTNPDRTILVTGGTGLVGSHLLYSLTGSGLKPRAIYRNESKLNLVRRVFGYYSDSPGGLFDRIEWIRQGLDDPSGLKNQMHGITHFYNCAAQVSFDPSNREKIIEDNLMITRNVVEACMELKVRLCHVSSVAAIGGNREGIPVTEKQEMDRALDASPYSISKYESEKLVWEAINKGLDAVIVNPSIIVGPGDWDHGSSAFFSGIRNGLPFYTNGKTGYVDVRDVVSSMITLMKSHVSGERYIISSESVSFHDIFSMIAENLGVRKPFIYTPKAVARAVLEVMKIVYRIRGKYSPLTTDTLRSAYSNNYFDCSKLVSETGISFIPIRKSIEDTCRLYIKEMGKA